MTPPSNVFILHKIKTRRDYNYYDHFIFMYPRSSSRELQDTPQKYEEQNES